MIVLTYVDDNLCVGHRAALEDVTKEIVKHGLQITVENEFVAESTIDGSYFRLCQSKIVS